MSAACPTCDRCNRPYRLRGQATDTTCSPCLRGRPAPLTSAVLSWHGLPLRKTRYQLVAGMPADLPDDGHIDEVAVRRILNGERRGVRLTPRELVCIVHDAARVGVADSDIANLLDVPVGQVAGYRTRNNIQSGRAYPDDYLCQLILEPSKRAKAGRRALIQAGVIAA